MNENNAIASVLGDSEGLVRGICEESRPRDRAVQLISLALGGAAIFGLAVGRFVNWQIALTDAVKMAGIVLFSFALCLPTLYVSATISGCRIGFVRVALVGLGALACVGCILAALSPVLWLFAVSTATASMFVLLAFALAVVAAVLGARIFNGAVKAHAVAHGFGLYVWFVIFMIVALQSVTLVRPMLTPDSAPVLGQRQGKCLFLAHFFRTLEEDCNRGNRSIML